MRRGYGRAVNFPPPTAAPPPAPIPQRSGPSWTPATAEQRAKSRRFTIISCSIVAVLAVGGITVSLIMDHNKTKVKKPGQTICQIVADPADDALTVGDIANLANISTRALRAFVLENCPDQYYRVQ